MSGRLVVYDDMLEEYGICAELDGCEVHERAFRRFRDADRDNVNNLRGRLVLRFGWVQMLDPPCPVASQRYTALTSRGWPGGPVPCGPSCTAGLIEL